MPYLLIVEDQQKIVEFSKETFVIGREENCDLVLPYKSVSRRHAQIYYDNGFWYIKDLNSTNGTYLNGNQVEDSVILNDKDEIGLGNVILVFSYEEPEFIENSPFMTQVSSPQISSEQFSSQAQRLHTLLELSKYLNLIHDLNKLLHVFLESTLKLLGADRGFVMLKNSQNQFDVVVQKLMKTDLKNKTYSKTACLKAIKEKKYVLSGDTLSDDIFSQQNSIIVNQISSILVVPIIIKDEVIGLIYIDNIKKDKSFSQDDAEFAQAIASQAAISIYNTRLYQSLLRERNLVHNILKSMGDGLLVLDDKFNLIRINDKAKEIFTQHSQLDYLIKDISTLKGEDSIIDFVALKPEFLLLSSHVKFFQLTPETKGVIVNLRDMTNIQREKSLKNRLFTILSEHIIELLQKIELESKDPDVEEAKKMAQLEGQLLRMEAGPLRLSRGKYYLKDIFWKDENIAEKFIDFLKNKGLIDKKYEFDLEAINLFQNIILSLGKVEVLDLNYDEKEVILNFDLLIIPTSEKVFSDLEYVFNSNFDLLELLKKVEDNEVLKRGLVIGAILAQKIILAHGGKMEAILDKIGKIKIKFSLPLLEGKD